MPKNYSLPNQIIARNYSNVLAAYCINFHQRSRAWLVPTIGVANAARKREKRRKSFSRREGESNTRKLSFILAKEKRARMQQREKGQKGHERRMRRAEAGEGLYPADLVNGEPEASTLTSIRHTYEKAFRLVVRSDLCQLRREAAATNFTRVPLRKRRRRRRKNWRRGMRLSIFTSSLNYENFVSLLEISP